MMARSSILHTLREDGARARVAAILSREQHSGRRAASRRVCEEFSFRDAAGRWQLSSCLKALTTLALSYPEIRLPAAQAAAVDNSPRLLDGEVPLPVGVPSRLSGIAQVQLSVVTEVSERTVWNTLMAREHPHGMTTFAGCQVRYLVTSEHGILGAVGISAAALTGEARDRWMAWTPSQRRDHLQRVVCLSRFLLRVRCRHLASHVLGRLLRRLPRDFEARYGFRPLVVETYADEGYAGTCLRAANFVCAGRTKGRGRQDRHHRAAKTVKTVWMRGLDRRWRRKLGVGPVDPAWSLGPGDGLDGAVWAANEFGGAPLGDKRLSARLVKSAALLASCPGSKIHASTDADNTAISAFYRLIEKPVESAVTVANILAPHRERTIRRIQGQTTVLAIQDGSDLNFSRRPGCEGLQVIGKNQTSSSARGLHLHATLAVSETGLPLGVLRLGFDAVKQRSPAAEERLKSRRWMEGFKDIDEAVRDIASTTRVISVCDREADFFELFDHQRLNPRVGLLVRARHDRVLGKGRAKLFATLSAGSPDGGITVEVDGLSERPKASRTKARAARRKRVAQCALRFRRVTLPSTLEGRAPLALSGVHIIETDPPEGENPVQWFLLTTLKVRSAEDAARMVGFYLQRWKVEDFFRVLKSGCRTEFLLFRTAERLQRAIAINAVIAWRIMVMTLLGRQVPDCEPELMFTDQELSFLRDYAAEKRMTPPDRLGDAVRLVAHLGGYQDRKHDPEPGHQIMWHGATRLTSAVLGHQVGFRAGQRQPLQHIQTLDVTS